MKTIYPFVKQEGIKDCAVSCLAMIIKYYKGYVPYEVLREKLNTNSDGTSALSIINLAKEIGFEAMGIKGELTEELITPCIAHVKIDNYLHYVVVYKINFKTREIIIADPASKIKKLSFTEFEKIWTKVLILLHPIKKIPLYDKNKVSVFIKNLIFPYNNHFKYLIIVSFFVMIFTIISTFYFKFIIDSVNKNNLIFIFILFSFIYIMKIITSYIRNLLLIELNEKIDVSLTLETFKKIVFLPYQYYKNRPTGEIISRLNDLNSLKEIISKVVITLSIDFPLCLITLLALYILNSTLFIIVIASSLLYVLIFLIFNCNFEQKVQDLQIKKSDINNYMVETIAGFETIKGLNIADKRIDNFENKYVNLIKTATSLDTSFNKQLLLKYFIDDFSFLIIIFVGLLLMFDNKITLSNLLVFNAMFGYAVEPIKNLLNMTINLKESKNAIKRVMNIIVLEQKKGIINSNAVGLIKFCNTNYSYNNHDLVLNNISLEIPSGFKIMLTGESASGKSTLCKILKGYLKPHNGEVYINGIDINDYENLNSVAYLSQNELLFTDTVYNNLDNKNFLEISKMCYVDEIVKNSLLGYNMMIEENGFNLSGGQRQRIILAKYLLKPWDILIIDEGTNQMDVNLERKILKNIFKYFKDKTIIIISHRYDNLDLFDGQIHMANGQLKEVCFKNV